jgi:hypothetical protein
MAGFNEGIKVLFGGDTSGLRASINDANTLVGGFSSKTQKALDGVGSKIGNLKSLGGALAVALGINFQNIAENLARMVIGFSKASEESLKAQIEATDRLADAQERALEKMRSAKEKERQDEYDRINSTLDLRRDAILKAIEYEKKAREEIAKAESDAGFAADLEWVKEQDRIAADKKLKLEQIMAIKAAELSAAEEVARVEKARVDEMFKSYIDQWTGLQVLIGSRGRSDTELTDRELERKISNIQSELSAASGRSLGTYQGSAGTGSSDFLTEQQRGAANQARAELDFRNRVRQTASMSGEDAAFRQFSGLSEQRFREILQSAPSTQDVVAELKKLNGHMNKGIPMVFSGTNE